MLSENHAPTARNRRQFIFGGLAGLGLLALPAAPAWAKTRIKPAAEKSLAFYNINTGEFLKAAYYFQGRYSSENLTKINHILRDHRSDSVHPIEVELLDALHRLQRKMDTKEAFHIISGYRSPKTNAMLRTRAERSGVAKKSLHMEGRAIDIRLPGRSLADVRDAALALKLGGVGYYPLSGFVHLDIGPVRSW